MDYRAIADEVAATGLMVRGGFHPGPDDRAPEGAATVVLVGNAGPEMWRAFAAAATAEARDKERNPLNDWTRRVLGDVARAVSARVAFPFDGPPYPPFQRWALRAGGVFPSPIGPLIHPTFGLWHAYRGALLFAEMLALPAPPADRSPCETCADKPCLAACPVDAFGPGVGPALNAAGFRYDVPACVRHVVAAAGGDCLEGGCLARRACPVGRDFIYGPDQARFHMRKFLAAQGV